LDIPKDVVFQQKWEQRLLEAAKLLESVMIDTYGAGLERSDKLFLAKCL
jgi:hypothetical protein